MTEATGPVHARTGDGFWRLALAAMGVVYGDIGTSPLYAFRESIAHVARTHGSVDRGDVIGVISLMLWALIAIVSCKYVLILLRLDNKGEGGTLSLMALVQQAIGKRTPLLFLLGVLGAGLFYGDAMLTPAISVLSAVEGLAVLPGLEGRVEPYIMPLTIGILAALFLVQRRGSGVVGVWFGPICVVWFAVLAIMGVSHLAGDLAVLAAFNPLNAVAFLADNGVLGLFVLGSVFLTVTGAEALYADMGHFGRKPIAAGWVWLVFPCLSLNYLGQGALVLADPSTLSNPFFLMPPEALRPALVVLSTAATIIASQAVISGAFSLTQQAIHLGLLPRLQIQRTSETQFGQIYMPQVNYLLMVGVIYLTLAFGTSSALGAAYGVAVIGAMITSSLLAIVAIWKVMRRPLQLAVAIMAPFILIEVVFFGANMLKVMHGGFVPLLIALGFALVMWTWVRGVEILRRRERGEADMASVLAALGRSSVQRVEGTAVFLTADPQAVPTALLHNLKHNHVLHRTVIFLTVRYVGAPRVPDADRVEVATLSADVRLVTLSYGFMETPNVSRGLALAREKGVKFDIMTTSFFLSRRTLVRSAASAMPAWQAMLFGFLARNASKATEFFHIPTSRVVELGAQVAV